MSEKKSTFKLAVVGNPSSVMLYKVLGCDAFGVTTDEEGRDKVEKLFRMSREDENKTAVYAVVFVDETLYKTFSEDSMEKFSKKALPAIIPVPSPTSGDDNFAGKRLRKIVERAVGSDILG